MLQDMFGASLGSPASADPRRGRKWYFERLEVQTIKSNVTLIPRPGSRDTDSASTPGRIRMAAALGINFIDINNVPLKINALAFQNALLSPSILMSHITRHLINSVCSRLQLTLEMVMRRFAHTLNVNYRYGIVSHPEYIIVIQCNPA